MQMQVRARRVFAFEMRGACDEGMPVRRLVSNTNLESLDRPLVVLVLFAGAVVVFWTARVVQLLSLLLVDFAQPR